MDVVLEKAQTLSDRVKEVMGNGSNCVIDSLDALGGLGFGSESYLSFFAEDHALFAHETMQQMTALRDMESYYGIVPNPKWDEEQAEYRHRASPGSGVIAVPTSVQDPQMAGAVLEYGAWLSHYTLMPAYYEVTIKVKRTRDEDAERMLDLIHDTICFDIGDLFDSINMATYVWNSYEAGSFAQVLGASEKKIQKSISKVAAQMEKGSR